MTDRRIFGTYFYPPLFFEEIPPKFKEMFDKFETPPYSQIEKPIHTFRFLEYEIRIDPTGFIFITHPDKDVSADILNLIFLSTTLLTGYAVRLMNPTELNNVIIIPDTKEFHISEIKISTERGWLHIFPEIRKEVPRCIILKKVEFQRILKFAEEIFRSSLRNAILTFYECYTMFDKGYFTSSFLFGWMTIEIFLSKKLEEYFVEKSVSRQLINKLNKDLPIFKKMNYLRVVGHLQKDELENYRNLSEIRNRIIHTAYRPTSDQAEDCKLIANRILWELFRMDGIDYKSYHDK